MKRSGPIPRKTPLRRSAKLIHRVSVDYTAAWNERHAITSGDIPGALRAMAKRTPVRTSLRKRTRNASLSENKRLCRRLVVELRDRNTCQRCGRRHEVRAQEWAHVITRNAPSLICVEWNTMSLCGPRINNASCHGWFDNNKEAGMAWWREKFPERALALDLWRHMRNRPRIDREAERLYLLAQIAVYEARSA